jgi:uncharacterized RDD family membrane protein YckC
MRQADGILQCSQCRSPEIDASGTCKVCGYANTLPADAAPPPAPAAEAAELPATDLAGAASGRETAQADLPEWRRELARRLQEIKQKRENANSCTGFQSADTPAGSPPEGNLGGEQAEPPSPGRQVAAPAGRPEPVCEPEPSAEADRTVEDLRSLIDRVIKKDAMNDQEAVPGTPESPMDIGEETLAGIEPESDRLILLSRTFSGLVDLVIVVLMASAMIYAVDVIEGIEIFDTVSLLHYLALLAAVFLAYSVFFLASANQTIGMMITDMRIISESDGRTTLGQVFVRALAFLPSLLAAGAGLVVGLFDPQARCLHDRLSRTRVIRI